MSSTRTIVRTVLAVPIIAAATLALTGCGVIDAVSSGFTNNVESRYYDYEDLNQNADLVFRDAEWVPSDATSIGVRYFTDKPGNTLSFSSTEGVGASDCEPGALTGTPALEASWWPSSVPDEGMTCGEWQVFESDGTWHAWTN